MKFIINSIIAILALIVIVSAVVVETNRFTQGILEPDNTLTITNTPITNVNAIGFICSSPNCATVSGNLFQGTLNSGNTNQLNITYPTNLASPNGYGVYFFKDGFIPDELNTDWNGTGTIGPFQNHPSKQRICKSNIISVNATQAQHNIIVTIIVAAPTNHSGPLKFVPAQIAHHYRTNVTLDFTASENGVQYYADQRILQVPFSGQGSFTFTVAAQQGNNYTASVATRVDDAKCLTTQVQSQSVIITNQTNTNATRLPVLQIISPQNQIYNTTTIPVNILAINATEIRFSTTGIVNQLYTGITTITLPEGQHNLTATATNANGSVSQTVTFTINTTGTNPNTGLPTVSIHSPQNRTYTTNTVLVNITAQNAQEIRFSTTGINNQIYTQPLFITVPVGSHTLSATATNANGSITDVVRFTILANQTIPTDDDDDDEKPKKRKIFGDVNVTAQQPVQGSFQPDANTTIVLSKKSTPKSYSSIADILLALLLMMVVALIVLIAILLVIRYNK